MGYVFEKLTADTVVAQDWRPIVEYDRESDVLLRDGANLIFGYWADEQWWQLLDGLPVPRPDIAPDEFTLLPYEAASAWATM